MAKNGYWEERKKAEREWQDQQDKDLDRYIQHLSEMYQKVIDNINREIKADIGASKGHLIKAEKISEFELLAKEMIKKAEALREKGLKVSRKDFSKDVNDRLKIYNATMRINRNEILKSMIGEQLVDLGIEQEIDLTEKLWNDYTKEKERQAGILKVSTKSKIWSSTDTAEIIYGQIANGDFSSRIWANIDSLKGKLDGLVSTAIIRGDNPREMARWLISEVSTAIDNQKYVAERLARSETARVHFTVQRMSAIQNGYKYVKWYAEGAACKYCKAIVSDDVGFGESIYPVKEVPDIPVHPNCMCSIGAYWIEDEDTDKASELNDDQISQKYLNSNIIEALGKDDSLNIARIIDKSPDYMKKVWIKYKDKLKISSYNKGMGTSFYKSGMGVTLFKDAMNLDDDPDYYQKKYDVFFHEFGHMIDDLSGDVIPHQKAGVQKFAKFLNSQTSDLFVETLQKDMDDAVDAYYHKIVDNLEIGEIRGNVGQVKGQPGRWIKIKKDGTPTKAALNQFRRDAKYNYLQDVKAKHANDSKQDVGDLSDVLSGFGYEFPLGVGHSASYWKKSAQTRSNRMTEFFAEATSATINNPGSKEMLEKYFPETMAKYKEALEKIGESND